MVYSTVTASRNVVGFMKYVRDEKSHTDGKDRVLSYDTQNVMLHNAEKSMLTSLYRHGKSNNVHGTAVLMSFDKSELTGDNQDDVEKALRISKNVCLEMVKANEFERLSDIEDEDQRNELALAEAEKYKMVMVAQNDGKSGNLHVHAFVMNINPETGRSLNGKSRYHSFVKNAISHEMSKEQVKEFDYSTIKDKATKWEKNKREKGEYVWRDDLKERIKTALNAPNVVSDDVWEMELGKAGVNVKKRGKGYSFAFTDEDGKERKARGGKLGSDFEMTQIQNVFQLNLQKQREEEKAEADKKRIESAVKRERQISRPKPSLTDLSLEDIISDYNPSQKPQKAPESILRPQTVKYTLKDKKSHTEEMRASHELDGRKNEIEKKPKSKALGNDGFQETKESPAGLNSGVGREEVQNPLLEFAKNHRFVMFQPNGNTLISRERMTFKERFEAYFKRELTDEALLRLAENFEFRPSRYRADFNAYTPVDKVGARNPNVTLKDIYEKEQQRKNKANQILEAYEPTKQSSKQYDGPSF